MTDEKKCFLFNDIQFRKFDSPEVLKAKPPSKDSIKWYENNSVCLLEEVDDCLVFKANSFGCPKVMNVWKFYIQDNQMDGFKKVFDWVSGPYIKQLEKERDEKKQLKQEVKFLEKHIQKYLPEHEIVPGGLFDDSIHWKPKGRKLVK